MSKSAENGFGAASRCVLVDGHSSKLPQSDLYRRAGWGLCQWISITDGCDEKSRKLQIGSIICPDRRSTDRYSPLGADLMSLLLHIVVKLIFFAVLAGVVLTLLTWLTKKTRSDQIAPPSGEWPEDKATHMDRISAQRPMSSSRDSKGEQGRRQA